MLRRTSTGSSSARWCAGCAPAHRRKPRRRDRRPEPGVRDRTRTPPSRRSRTLLALGRGRCGVLVDGDSALLAAHPRSGLRRSRGRARRECRPEPSRRARCLHPRRGPSRVSGGDEPCGGRGGRGGRFRRRRREGRRGRGLGREREHVHPAPAIRRPSDRRPSGPTAASVSTLPPHAPSRELREPFSTASCSSRARRPCRRRSEPRSRRWTAARPLSRAGARCRAQGLLASGAGAGRRAPPTSRASWSSPTATSRSAARAWRAEVRARVDWQDLGIVGSGCRAGCGVRGGPRPAVLDRGRHPRGIRRRRRRADPDCEPRQPACRGRGARAVARHALPDRAGADDARQRSSRSSRPRSQRAARFRSSRSPSCAARTSRGCSRRRNACSGIGRGARASWASSRQSCEKSSSRRSARIRPAFALIAGGRPDQARVLEDAGIKTYLHIPSPGLLGLYVKDGARRFIFEGRECGGHVGPRSSFVLWDTMVRALLEQVPAGTDGSEYHVLFAGGIHDGRSAAMVAAMAAPLTTRGIRVGVLMGTAYLFTEEAVRAGAITTKFQEAAVSGSETALLETSPGHATRCLSSPFVDEFREEKRRLRRENTSHVELRDRLELMNLGRLRIAAKGVDRHPNFRQDADAPKLVVARRRAAVAARHVHDRRGRDAQGRGDDDRRPAPHPRHRQRRGPRGGVGFRSASPSRSGRRRRRTSPSWGSARSSQARPTCAPSGRTS